MRRASVLLAALFVCGCGGSSGTDTGASKPAGGPTVKTATRTVPERPAVPTVLGVASRYVDSRVADGKLPAVHVGRAGILGKVALVYLVGGSDVGAGAGGAPVKGLYGVLVVANQGGTWRVEPPPIAFGGHS